MRPSHISVNVILSGNIFSFASMPLRIIRPQLRIRAAGVCQSSPNRYTTYSVTSAVVASMMGYNAKFLRGCDIVGSAIEDERGSLYLSQRLQADVRIQGIVFPSCDVTF